VESTIVEARDKDKKNWFEREKTSQTKHFSEGLGVIQDMVPLSSSMLRLRNRSSNFCL